VYSFGIILWESLVRKEPFSNHSDFDIFVEAVCVSKERPPLPHDILPSLKKLIERCWDGTPAVRPSFPAIVDALENIIIECSIDDDVGRNLWKTYFLRRDHVFWADEFVPVLAQFVGTPLPNPNKDEAAFQQAHEKLIETLPWRCLYVLVADKKQNEEPVVHLEKFGQILNWFGPLKDPDGVSRFLPRIQQILSQDWFQGNLDYDGAVHLLSAAKPGTYLIRFSSKENPGCFTISKVNAKSKIVHQRILHKLGGPFSIAESKSSYPSLIDLVDKAGQELKLETTCGSSPYAYLFLNKEKVNKNVDLYGDTEDD